MFGSNHRVELSLEHDIVPAQARPGGRSGTAGAAVERPAAGLGHGSRSASRDDWTISPNMVNHFSFAKNTFTRTATRPTWTRTGRTRSASRTSWTATRTSRRSTSPSTRPGARRRYNGTDQPGWGIKNDLSYIRGSHTLKFGFQHQNQNADGFGQQDIAGRADFNFLSTSIPGASILPGERRQFVRLVPAG